MRSRIIGACALLIASAAQAERVSEPYAKVGYWEITAENHSTCVMKTAFPGKVAGDAEALMIAYNAVQKNAVLGWITQKPKLPALSDSLDFQVSFLKGRSLNDAWGTLPFDNPNSADTFIHAFRGPTDSDRFLAHIAASEALVLSFGPVMLTSLPLKASDAVKKLRECSSKIAEQGGSDGSQQ